MINKETNSQFIGTMQDFKRYIGGYCKLIVNQLAKKYREACNKTCQYCKNSNVELDSAHITGRDRNGIIESILNNHFKTNDNYYTVNMDDFIKYFKMQHDPIYKVVYFLCKDCHKKYDSKKITDDEIKLAIENNIIKNSIQENVSKKSTDKSNKLEETVQNYVKRILQDSYNNGLLNEEILTNLQNPIYCKNYLDMYFPLLTTDYKKTFDSKGYSRYYKNYNLGDKYYLCSQLRQDQKILFENFFNQLELDIKSINNNGTTCDNIGKYNIKKETNKSKNKKSFEDDEIIHLFRKFKHEVCKTDLKDLDKKIDIEIDAINSILNFNNINSWKKLCSSDVFYKLLNKYENLHKNQSNNTTKIYLDSLYDLKWFIKKYNLNSINTLSIDKMSDNIGYYHNECDTRKTYLYSSLQEKYSDFLSKNYAPTTIKTYCSSINGVLNNENYESWERVAQNINKLLVDYDMYGCKSELGQHGHASVINALRRFKEFLDESR